MIVLVKTRNVGTKRRQSFSSERVQTTFLITAPETPDYSKVIKSRFNCLRILGPPSSSENKHNENRMTSKVGTNLFTV